MKLITSTLLQSTGLVSAGMSTRNGGVSGEPLGLNLSFSVGDVKENVEENRSLFFGKIGILPDQLALPQQIHSNIVKHVSSSGTFSQCDGLITGVSDVCLGISVADCAPILILDTKKMLIAAIHAGWRGTVEGVVRNGLQLMMDKLGCRPEDIVAFIGPCADQCCYVVGDEVATKFAPAFVRVEGKKSYVNLKAANKSQILEMGVAPDNVEVSPHCTIGESNLFHSFRRDGVHSGRMMAVIKLGVQRVD